VAKIPVKELYSYLEKMLEEKWGYIWGTAGVKWTQAKQNNLEKNYSPDDPNRGLSVQLGSKWIGHMVADCSGVMVYIWKQFGLSIPHGSNSIADNKRYTGAKTKIPKPGYAAFQISKDNPEDEYHIGIVGRDGKTVYEDKGTKAGFVTSDASKWDYFAPFTQVDYTEEEESKPVEQYFAVITGDKVRVRSGPGVNFKKIGEVNKGDIVTVLSKTDSWVFADTGKTQGYIYSQYVEKVDNPEPHEEDESDEETVVIELEFSKEAALELMKALEEGLSK